MCIFVCVVYVIPPDKRKLGFKTLDLSGEHQAKTKQQSLVWKEHNLLTLHYMLYIQLQQGRIMKKSYIF